MSRKYLEEKTAFKIFSILLNFVPIVWQEHEGSNKSAIFWHNSTLQTIASHNKNTQGSRVVRDKAVRGRKLQIIWVNIIH